MCYIFIWLCLSRYLHPSVCDVKKQIEDKKDRFSGKYDRGDIASENKCLNNNSAIRRGEDILWLVSESFREAIINWEVETL